MIATSGLSPMITTFHVCFAPALSPPPPHLLRQSPQQHARLGGTKQGSLSSSSSLLYQVFTLLLCKLINSSDSSSTVSDSSERRQELLAGSAAATAVRQSSADRRQGQGGEPAAAADDDDREDLLCPVLYDVGHCRDESVPLCQQPQLQLQSDHHLLLVPSPADTTEQWAANCSSPLCHQSTEPECQPHLPYDPHLRRLQQELPCHQVSLQKATTSSDYILQRSLVPL